MRKKEEVVIVNPPRKPPSPLPKSPSPADVDRARPSSPPSSSARPVASSPSNAPTDAPCHDTLKRIEDASSQNSFIALIASLDALAPSEHLLLLQRMALVYASRGRAEKQNMQSGFCRVAEAVLDRRRAPSVQTIAAALTAIGAFGPFTEPMKQAGRVAYALESALATLSAPLPIEAARSILREPVLQTSATIRVVLESLLAAGDYKTREASRFTSWASWSYSYFYRTLTTR